MYHYSILKKIFRVKIYKMNTREKKYLITENNENFLREFLNDFYHRVIYSNNIDDFENFENKTIKWAEESQSTNLKKIIKSIGSHQKNESWFSGLIRFFHQHGIGGCEINKNKALELYLLAVNIE